MTLNHSASQRSAAVVTAHAELATYAALICRRHAQAVAEAGMPASAIERGRAISAAAGLPTDVLVVRLAEAVERLGAAEGRVAA